MGSITVFLLITSQVWKEEHNHAQIVEEEGKLAHQLEELQRYLNPLHQDKDQPI